MEPLHSSNIFLCGYLYAKISELNLSVCAESTAEIIVLFSGNLILNDLHQIAFKK